MRWPLGQRFAFSSVSPASRRPHRVERIADLGVRYSREDQTQRPIAWVITQQFTRAPGGVGESAFFERLEESFGPGDDGAALWKRGAIDFVDFNGSVDAGHYALKGQLLYDAPDPTLGELQLIVIGEFAPGLTEVTRTIGHLLDNNNTRLFCLDDIDKLVEEIRSTANVA